MSISASKQIYHIRRDINNYTINQLMLQLSYENWDDVFSETTANMAFNKFLNIFLRIFYTCFPLVKSLHSFRSKPCLTLGIKTSYANSRKLYLLYRNNNDRDIKGCFKKYFRILYKVINTKETNMKALIKI
jgi:hypothetical protein